MGRETLLSSVAAIYEYGTTVRVKVPAPVAKALDSLGAETTSDAAPESPGHD